MPEAGLTPSQIDAQREAQAERNVAEIKRTLQGERSALDRVRISLITLETSTRTYKRFLYISLTAEGRYMHIAPSLPDSGEAPGRLSALLREAADAIDAMTADLAGTKEPNAD